jgi:hypothetical protein
MKARHLIGSASFGPEALKVITQAFDDTWNSIAADFGNNPLAIEAARLKLANIILAIAQNEGGDPRAAQAGRAHAYGEGRPNRG